MQKRPLAPHHHSAILPPCPTSALSESALVRRAQLQLPAHRCEQHIVGLYVHVNHAPGVQEVERFGDLQHDAAPAAVPAHHGRGRKGVVSLINTAFGQPVQHTTPARLTARCWDSIDQAEDLPGRALPQALPALPPCRTSQTAARQQRWSAPELSAGRVRRSTPSTGCLQERVTGVQNGWPGMRLQ